MIGFGKKYKVIYADPPWKYSDKLQFHGGGADSHYQTMTTDQICELPVKELADEDSVLFMWVTFPMLPDALKVMDRWGFTYKTVAFTWIKTNPNGKQFLGLGRYTRGNAEICLLGRRGKGCTRICFEVPNTQQLPREAHSKKPDKFRNDIVRLFGDVARIELFSREKIEGWDVWGNETPKTTQILLEK